MTSSLVVIRTRTLNNRRGGQHVCWWLHLLLIIVAFDSASCENVQDVSSARNSRMAEIVIQGLDDTQPGHFAKSMQANYARIGSKREASGTVVKMPDDESGEADNIVFEKKPKDWVAFFHYSLTKSAETSSFTDSQAATLMNRMRNAVMFGASAILILVMNPRLVKEFDVPQMFTQPIILLQTAANMTSIMEALLGNIILKIKISSKKIDSPQTVTLWSSCWRPRPGSGVVCLGNTGLSKEDPGYFWNYFFSLLATLILLMILKNKENSEEHWDPMDQGQVLRSMAKQALEVMTVRRVKNSEESQKKESCDCSKDLCAICLDNFYPKQRLRVLPCFHEFHAMCVDPWLLAQATCPLCKHNILNWQLN